MDQQRKHIIEGNPYKVIWTLSWPAIVAMVLYGLNNFLDGIFVGHLINNTALAAVGVAYPLAQFIQGFGTLIGTGLGTAISIWIGANEKDKLERSLGTANLLTLIFSIIITIPCYYYAEELIYLMGGRGEIKTLATEYLRVTIIGSVFWIHGLALNMTIRAEGKMKTAAWMIAIGLVVDVLLKPLFIETFGWGVSGAAWATNISMIIYMLLGINYYSKGRATFKTNIWSIKWDKEIVYKTCAYGFPGFIMMVMIVIQNIVVFNALSKYGKDIDITFYAAVNRFYILLNTPLWGLMRALQPITGMNYGAEKYKRVITFYKLSALIGLLILLPFYTLVLLYTSQILSIMIPNMEFTSQQLLDFKVYMSVLLILPFLFMAMVWLPSIEQAKKATYVTILRQLIFFLPIMLIVPRYYGVNSIYYAGAIIEWIVFIITMSIVYKNFNRLRQMEK